MELLLVLALLGLFIWVANLQSKLTLMEMRLRSGAPPEPQPAAAEIEMPEPEPEPEAEPEPEPVSREVVFEWQPDGRLEDALAPKESLGGLFERLVAGRLLIWLGGMALVLAAVFLIRYSIEVGLMTPGQRMIGAAIFGLVLLGAGEYARAGRFADDPRIAQALVGAGIVTLYATAYGSYVLYGLLGPGAASGAMVAVTAAALVLSLRHGAPTAVMGLIGGFLTPALVGNPDAGAVPLLAYLALLDLALFAIAWRRGWTWLAASGVALSFVWTGYLLTRPPDDALAAGAFVILLALAGSVVRPGKGRQLSLIQPLALGILQLAILVGRTDLGPLAWVEFGALSAATLVLAVLRNEYRLAPPLALGLALLLLMAKAANWQDPLVPYAAIGISALFGGGGLALTFWRRQLLWTGIAAVGLAAPALIVRALRPDLLTLPAWGTLMAALAIGPVLLIWANRKPAPGDPSPSPALLIACGAAAALAGAAVWDLLPAAYVAAGWLGIALALAFVARRLDDLAPDVVALIVATLGGLRALAMVPELGSIPGRVMLGFPITAEGLPGAVAVFSSLALPALLLAALHFVLPPLPPRGRWVLPAVAGAFALAALYLWFKQAFGLAEGEDFIARGMIERTILTQILFAAGWLLGAGRIRPARLDPAILVRAGTLLTAVAAARLIWLDLLTLNPVSIDQWVGPVPVLNLILPAYLLSAVWLYAARRRSDAATRSGFWLLAFLAALIGGAALLVRQYFHGAILTGWEMPIAEFYGYSLAGLAVAIGLIVAGIRLKDKALRLAGLLLLTATIFKVFLIDASELEGVLRILSFLGLGVALIGIGRLYGPVLRAETGDGA